MKNTLHVTTPTDLEIVMTRTFAAPRQLVWDTMCRPELLKKWLFGPPGWEMTACDDDLRVGGEFRWAWLGPDGAELTIRGVYQEVDAPARVVRTEVFEMGGSGPPMGEQLAALALAEAGRTTLLTITLLYATKEARDGAVASGMEHGMAAGYDRLDGVLSAAAA